MEAIFDTCFVISERERYNHLLASLKQDEISRVGYVYLSDVGCTPYTKLKVTLIEHYEMNEVTRLNKLLNATTLSGNERPSDLLHRIKNLVGYDGKVSDDLLKKLFLDRMPADMHLILAACYELNVYDLAAKADSIFMFSSESVPANINLLDCRLTTNFNLETAGSTVKTQTFINSNLQSQIYTMDDELRDLKRSVGMSSASNQPRPSYLNPRSDCKETYRT